MRPAWEKYLDDQTIVEMTGLRIQSSRAVIGTAEGIHRSPQTGQAIEFSQHREYTPGDDLRWIDWKVFGRSDRYYLRQGDIERSCATHLILDHSKSMAFSGPRSHHSKLEFAKRLAMAVAYLSLSQHDPVSLAAVSDTGTLLRPASTASQQLTEFQAIFDRLQTDQHTNLARSLAHVSSQLSRTGLVVLISDLLDDEENVHAGLSTLQGAGYDVIVMHTLDREEIEFRFSTDMQFSDLEGFGQLDVDAMGIRNAYLREMKGFLERMKNLAHGMRFGYSTVITDESVLLPLRRHFS